MLLVIAVFVLAAGAEAAAPSVTVLEVKGTINPIVADYIRRGIEQAERDNAVACIIQMDTPGGLDTAMRDIIQTITSSRVPVVVFVAPSGGRAASAGTYITLSAHIAAMAPNTTIGAATPVQLGTEGEAQVSDEMKNKIINDAIAYIRGLAETRGRNVDWAEKAVRDGDAISAREALETNVIDIMASDVNDLLARLDGRGVTLLDGTRITLSMTGATVKLIPMNAVEGILHTLADPNIAYLLLTIAGLGILTEITNPGLIFPGVIGVIAGILSFYSLGQLPVNMAGVLLIILAFGLFVAEVFTVSHGLLTAGGVTALVLGSLILFQGRSPLFQVSLWLIALVALFFAGIFFFVVSRVVQAHRRQASTGREELIGKTATARTALAPEGIVFLEGERWQAVSGSGRVEAGETVVITRKDGLTLHVTKKQEPGIIGTPLPRESSRQL